MAKQKKANAAVSKPATPDVNAPLPVKIIGWFGICFSLTYLLWGVVSIVLSILDRTFADFNQNLMFIFYGLPILIIAINFKNLKQWAFYGLGAIFLFATVWSFFKYMDGLTIIDGFGFTVGVLSLIALVNLFMPYVRKHYI